MFQTPYHSPEEHEYQALEANHQQPYLESSPELYAANSFIESKYHPQNFVKSYVRSKFVVINVYALGVIAAHNFPQ